MRTRSIAILCAAAILPAAVVLAQDTATPASAVNNAPRALPDGASCSRSLLTSYDPNKGEFFGHNVSVWDIDAGSAVIFQSGMTIDADGAPNAYNPDNTGLDDLSNAGQPGHWDGIIAGPDGEPLVQGPGDPFPGFYISCTALTDWTKPLTDPTRYVDASKIPYVVLPGGLSREVGARLGDLAVVINVRNGARAGAIFADIGTLGEGSIALADRLGIHSDARIGGTRGGVLYLIYPGSGEHRPRPIEEINSESERVFQAWGGPEKLNTCLSGPNTPPVPEMAQRNTDQAPAASTIAPSD